MHWLVKTTHKIEQGKTPLLLCCEESEPNQAFSTGCPSALDQEEGQARSRGTRQYLKEEQGITIVQAGKLQEATRKGCIFSNNSR